MVESRKSDIATLRTVSTVRRRDRQAFFQISRSIRPPP